MKRILSLVLALAMLVVAVPALALTESGYPVSEEPITMTMMTSETFGNYGPDQMPFFDFMSKLTNVYFEFETVPNSATAERKNLAFASGDLPNVMFNMGVSMNEESDYGAQGLLLSLEDLIDQHCPEILHAFDVYDTLRRDITCDDGHIYSLFYRSGTPRGSQYCFWYNAKWLDALGIEREELPTTLDGLHDLAVRFRDEDPNGNGEADERVIAPVGISGFCALVMNAYGVVFDGSGFCAQDDGSVKYMFTSDEYRDYLELARKWYEEGLLNPDVFTDGREQLLAYGADNMVGITSGSLPDIFGFVNEEIVAYPMAATFVGGDNTTPVKNMNNAVTGGRFVITNTATNEQAEAAIRWADYLYSKDGSMLSWWGPEGIGYNYLDDTRTKFERVIPEGEMAEQYRARITPGTVACIIWPSMLEGLTSTEDVYANSQAIPHMDELKLAYPRVFNTEAERGDLSIYGTDVATYREEMEAQFITGRMELDDATWQTYVETVNQMGVDEMIKIYTDAYARYLAK